MRVLITGGAGFIGSAMIRHLQQQHPQVIVRALDLVPPTEGGVEYVIGSILDANDLLLAVQDCDYVVHLAAMLGVRRTGMWPLQCMNVNVQGTVNLLDACVKERVKRIVFSSSSEVYGEPQSLPIGEEAPLNPRSVYATSKIAGEAYVKVYAERYGFDWSVVRFFNVYGPGQVAEFVIPRFIGAVQRGQRPVVYGDGRQVRAFCYVDDAVAGVVAALFRAEAAGQVFNIGNPLCAVAIGDLAHRVTTLLDGAAEPERVPFSRSDRSAEREIHARVPDISKAVRLLGYAPQVGLEDGIRRVHDAGPIKEPWFDPLHGAVQMTQASPAGGGGRVR